VPFKISDLLKSDDASLNEKGLRLAEGSNSPTLLKPLFLLARSNESKSSAAAGKLALKKAQGFLKGNQGMPKASTVDISRQIIETLDPSFILHLNYNVESGSTDEIIEALILLKYFVNDSRSEDILKFCIRNPDKKVRATAVKHIGTIASKVNAEVLSKFLEDSDNRVKANAIEVFESLKNKYFTRILDRFRNDENNRIRANALKTLHILGDDTVINDLEKMLKSQNNLMRTSAVWVIGELGENDSELLALLHLVKNDDDKSVQNNLLILLKKMGNIPQVEFIKDSLKEVMKDKLKNELDGKTDLVVENSQNGDYTLFKLRGILTAQTILVFKRLAEEIINNEKIFVLDFSGLEYIDSSGVGFLINFQKKLNHLEGALYIYACQFKILEMMQVSKIDMIINVFNTKIEVDEFLGV